MSGRARSRSARWRNAAVSFARPWARSVARRRAQTEDALQRALSVVRAGVRSATKTANSPVSRPGRRRCRTVRSSERSRSARLDRGPIALVARGAHGSVVIEPEARPYFERSLTPCSAATTTSFARRLPRCELRTVRSDARTRCSSQLDAQARSVVATRPRARRRVAEMRGFTTTARRSSRFELRAVACRIRDGDERHSVGLRDHHLRLAPYGLPARSSARWWQSGAARGELVSGERAPRSRASVAAHRRAFATARMRALASSTSRDDVARADRLQRRMLRNLSWLG